MLFSLQKSDFAFGHFVFLNEVYLCYSQGTVKESQVLPWFFHVIKIFGIHNRFLILQMHLLPEWNDSFDIESLAHL